MQSTGMFLDDFPVLRYQWKIFFKLLKYEKKFAIMFCFQGLIMDILLSIHHEKKVCLEKKVVIKVSSSLQMHPLGR